jgi:hypothetical protein
VEGVKDVLKPIIGDIVRGKDIGKQPPWKQYLWASCPECGKERWVQSKRGTPDHKICATCYLTHHNAENTWNYKGGRSVTNGYPVIRKRDHPRASPYTGYVLEHILVWEQVHNQPVPEGCQIHHLNGIKTDNRPSNLMCLTPAKHNKKHQTLLQARAQRIRELEAEVKLMEKALQDSQMIFRLEEN